MSKTYILYYIQNKQIHIEETGTAGFLKKEAKRLSTLRRRYIVTEFVDNKHIFLPDGRKYCINRQT